MGCCLWWFALYWNYDLLLGDFCCLDCGLVCVFGGLTRILVMLSEYVSDCSYCASVTLLGFV